MSISLLALIIFEGFLILIIIAIFPSMFKHAPFIPTTHKRVHRMLELTGLKKGELVVDLGAGDGRVLHCAVKHFGARGVGVEFSPLLAWFGNFWLKIKGLSNDAKIVRGDIFNYDCSKADVVTLFLLQTTNQKIKEKLQKEIKPGARVVSRIFTFKDWPAIASDEKYHLSVYKKLG